MPRTSLPGVSFTQMGFILLLVLASVLLSAPVKADSNVQQAKLHNMMTLKEMKDYLETDTKHDIPDYEAIRLSSPRSKRSISPSGKVYSMSAFGGDILLDLTTPSDTISDHGVIVQRRTAEGHYEETHRPDGEFFHGHVTGDDNSKVAVRISEDGKELSGSIFADGHLYKIQPINKRLRNKANLHGDGHHVISRRKFGKPLLEQLETSKVLSNAKIRDKRSADVNVTEPRIIELMITLDKTTYDFYGNQSLDYVLNVANMVNRFYRDPSMGFDLSVLLTKVFIIQHDEPALDIQTQNIDSAGSFLGEFRKWGAKQSALAPPGSPGHFDIAALLTRRICGKNHCELAGLAYSSYAPCNKDIGFSINNAHGLQAAFTVAHEMAHGIGIRHDKGKCNNGYMMNAAQASGPNAFRWSPCSSKRMKEIMSRGTCYSDKPALLTMLTYTMPTRYAGYVYNADKQCKMAYGSNYYICPKIKNICGPLLCAKNGGGGCVVYGAPTLDGTVCGQRKWCLRGNCVDIGNDLPPAVDGQWGSWSSHFTNCTRPCGGGVRYRKRNCDNPRPQYVGKFCNGSSLGHEEICNPQECKPEVNFRLEQCVRKGYDTFYYDGSNRCILRCQTGYLATLEGNVIDGTPCSKHDQDSKDRCIKGRCRKVGCDNVLESRTECPPEWKSTRWSKCSVQCGGGTRTRTVSCMKTLLDQSSISLADSNCTGYKPPDTEQCNTMDCYAWSKDYPCDGCSGYRHLGCFRDTRDRALPKLIKTNLPSKNTVHECYKAANALGYDMFAVQNQEECWVLAAGKPTYNKYGSSSSCKDGTGGPWANDVYQIAPPSKSFKPIGCYRDKDETAQRPLPHLVSNLRSSIDWFNLNKTIVQCSEDARDHGFPVFGVQFYGECWSGPSGHMTYDVDGASTNGCWEGVGRRKENYVYYFTNKVAKKSVTCRHIITNTKVSDDHCEGTKPDNDLRLCKDVCTT